MMARRMLILVVTAMVLSLHSTSAQDAKKTEDAAPKQAPESFQVKFETTCGDFTVEVTRKWAPNGADRFHELVESGFYNDAGFFRIVPGFVVQFGLAGDPAVQQKWTAATIKDDKPSVSNERGTVTFAMRGQDTRTTQLFVNYGDNSRLDSMGFAPFGKVTEGMEVVDEINSEHGQLPNQGLITQQGNAYLKSNFPGMDFIKKATIVKPAEKAK